MLYLSSTIDWDSVEKVSETPPYEPTTVVAVFGEDVVETIVLQLFQETIAMPSVLPSNIVLDRDGNPILERGGGFIFTRT